MELMLVNAGELHLVTVVAAVYKLEGTGEEWELASFSLSPSQYPEGEVYLPI